MNHNINIDDLLTIEIKKLGINGEGVGYHNKTVVFVKEAIPNEEVEVLVTNVFPNHVEGVINKIIEKSPYRLEITYPDLQASGAYNMQHITYDKMLEYKRDILIASLQRYLSKKVPYNAILPTIGNDEPLHYRNKVSLPARRFKNKNVFGLYKEKTTEFVPSSNSPVHQQNINKIIKTIEELMDKYQFNAYDNNKKMGFVKSVVIREGKYTNEVQVSFMLMNEFKNIDKFTNELVDIYPNIKSVFTYFTNKYSEQKFFSLNYKKIFGKDTINERINNQVFSLYPESFFQVNSAQADKFYNLMVDLANLDKEDICIDAYAGIGMISHYIYDKVKKVYAIEIEPRSVKSAKLSLKRNNINNVEVIQSDFGKSLKHLQTPIDVMFFDPPRGGLGSTTIAEVLKYLPKKIIYGSCNPSTLAKDLSELSNNYNIIKIVPFDMFPYTPLVESVTLLELKEEI